MMYFLKDWIWWILIVAFIGAVVIGGAVAKDDTAHVGHVIDGDTFVIEGYDKVRLVAVDAPEMDTVEGTEARQAAMRLLTQCEYQVSVHTQGTGYYGRTLARVECAGTDVGQYLLDNGYAEAYE